jgi:hypothetical protein
MKMASLESKVVETEKVLCYLQGDGRTPEAVIQKYDNGQRKVLCPLFDSNIHKYNYGGKGCFGTGNVCKYA